MTFFARMFLVKNGRHDFDVDSKIVDALACLYLLGNLTLYFNHGK